MTAALRAWPIRRWLIAIGVAVALTLGVAIPTALIDNPLFTREIPPTWWAWPGLLMSSLLAGLLTATYVSNPAVPDGTRDDTAPGRGGWAGGLLTFFAVGCPVCNKIVLLAVGSAGAMTWFAPIQPLLQLAALALLAWALSRRLRGELSCPTDPTTQEVHA